MDSKDKLQPPATQPPAVGPGTNAEDAAESLAYAKHIEQQRRPLVSRVPSSVSPANHKK